MSVHEVALAREEQEPSDTERLDFEAAFGREAGQSAGCEQHGIRAQGFDQAQALPLASAHLVAGVDVEDSHGSPEAARRQKSPPAS